ncbi:SRPBCC family protein [Mucilaginibacter myungsuensis]|uniref:DUF2892 domain-containing protein n=1 Tax=Mucilaginibacter myungsuensis TaxID=649104 RepID=A0A929PYL8_9SPHI|nr:SRPBCC family protein [Mucilaginibacter myungsuensis]MBE9664416.1 DUF2892 domain-containing protein [Mucilaginibacter myungsuensis]MDN3597127.1 SRPBCC family protein [Mucilaginibacter myungsuensis]
METLILPTDQTISVVKHINLKWPERVISVVAGVQIGLWGFKNLFKNPGSSILKIGAGGYLLGRGITGHCELYDMAGKTSLEPVSVNINTSVIVDKPREEVYAFWRDLSNLPLFMSHLKSVEVMNDSRSYWSLKLPIDVADIYWDASILEDIPGELIEWSSLSDSVIDTSGIVRFIDTSEPDQTLVHVTLTYQPPAGALGAGVAKIFNPLFTKMIEDDIQNFKRYMDIAAVIEEAP